MADLLAGLVFILIIVLQAVALVAREDFARADDVMRETRRIEERLERLRVIERHMILPREQTEAALAAIVAAITRDLNVAGLEAKAEPDGRRITINSLPLTGQEGFASSLPRTAGIIATTLQRWLPCLQPARPAACPGAGSAIATQIRIDSRSTRGPAAAGAGAAALSAEIGLRYPELAIRQGSDGAPLLTFRGVASPQDALDIDFQIQRSPLPQDTILVGPR